MLVLLRRVNVASNVQNLRKREGELIKSRIKKRPKIPHDLTFCIAKGVKTAKRHQNPDNNEFTVLFFTCFAFLSILKLHSAQQYNTVVLYVPLQ